MEQFATSIIAAAAVPIAAVVATIPPAAAAIVVAAAAALFVEGRERLEGDTGGEEVWGRRPEGEETRGIGKEETDSEPEQRMRPEDKEPEKEIRNIKHQSCGEETNCNCKQYTPNQQLVHLQVR